MDTQLINFTIPKKLLKSVDSFAKKQKATRSELLRQAVRKYLEDEQKREEAFKTIRKCAERINMDEDKAMALVDKIRDELPINQ